MKKMMGFIEGIPFMIPCDNCAVHAQAFVEKNEYRLKEVCRGRESLFRFFVDFHNKVNKAYGKPEFTYEQSWKLYTGELAPIMKY